MQFTLALSLDQLVKPAFAKCEKKRKKNKDKLNAEKKLKCASLASDHENCEMTSSKPCIFFDSQIS